MVLAILITLASLVFPGLAPAQSSQPAPTLEEDQLSPGEVECLVRCMNWCLWPGP